MKYETTFAVPAMLLAASLSASAALGNDAIEDSLGGAFITCTGAVAWTENGDEGVTRVEPMRLAVRDAEDANRVALFLSNEDTVDGNIWPCVEGLCAANAALATSVTTNVLRLRQQVELGSAEVVYGMEAVFMIVGEDGAKLQVNGTTGSGAFICEKALPAALVAQGN